MLQKTQLSPIVSNVLYINTIHSETPRTTLQDNGKCNIESTRQSADNSIIRRSEKLNDNSDSDDYSDSETESVYDCYSPFSDSEESDGSQPSPTRPVGQHPDLTSGEDTLSPEIGNVTANINTFNIGKIGPLTKKDIRILTNRMP